MKLTVQNLKIYTGKMGVYKMHDNWGVELPRLRAITYNKSLLQELIDELQEICNGMEDIPYANDC